MYTFNCFSTTTEQTALRTRPLSAMSEIACAMESSLKPLFELQSDIAVKSTIVSPPPASPSCAHPSPRAGGSCPSRSHLVTRLRTQLTTNNESNATAVVDLLTGHLFTKIKNYDVFMIYLGLEDGLMTGCTTPTQPVTYQHPPTTHHLPPTTRHHSQISRTRPLTLQQLTLTTPTRAFRRM